MKVIIKNAGVEIQTAHQSVIDLVDSLDISRLSTANPPIADDGTFDYQYGEVITKSAPQESSWDTVEYASNYYTTKHIALPSHSTKLHYVGKAVGTSGINIYNSSKELIASVSGIDTHQGTGNYLLDYEFELPANAAYIRTTCAASLISTTFSLGITYLD